MKTQVISLLLTFAAIPAQAATSSYLSPIICGVADADFNPVHPRVMLVEGPGHQLEFSMSGGPLKVVSAGGVTTYSSDGHLLESLSVQDTSDEQGLSYGTYRFGNVAFVRVRCARYPGQKIVFVAVRDTHVVGTDVLAEQARQECLGRDVSPIGALSQQHKPIFSDTGEDYLSEQAFACE